MFKVAERSGALVTTAKPPPITSPSDSHHRKEPGQQRRGRRLSWGPHGAELWPVRRKICHKIENHLVRTVLRPSVAMPSLAALFGHVEAHGRTARSIMSAPEFTGLPRNLKVVELFSGVGSVHKAGAKLGHNSAGFDKVQGGQSEDATTWPGFYAACCLIMRLAVGGLLLMAPPCNSWVQLNAANCQRKLGNGFLGNQDYGPVRIGNLLMHVTCVLLLLANHRGVHVVIENPPASNLWKVKPLVDIIAVLKMVRITTPYCAFSRKPFGQRYAKKFFFAATGGWIEFIVRPCTCPDRKHKLMSRNYVVGGKLKFDGKPKDLPGFFIPPPRNFAFYLPQHRHLLQ